MKTSRFTDSQIIAVLKEVEAGTPVPALCRTHGISSATFYKWRAKFGGMEVPMVARMKELEEENRRLKKMYAEAQLSTDLLREALVKKWCGHRIGVRWPQRGHPARGPDATHDHHPCLCHVRD
jgi:putative transposase